MNGKGPKLKATAVTCSLTQAGQRDMSPKFHVVKLMTQSNISLKGISEFWVGSGCQLLVCECCVTFSLTGLSSVLELSDPLELMTKIHLEPWPM